MWDEKICIQCGKCVLVCPHAVIRAKIYECDKLLGSPETFKAAAARWNEFKDLKYTLQVSLEDRTGCGLCIEARPVKDKTQVKRRAINMHDQVSLRESESKNWDFFVKPARTR